MPDQNLKGLKRAVQKGSLPELFILSELCGVMYLKPSDLISHVRRIRD